MSSTKNPAGPFLIGNYFKAIRESVVGPIQRDNYLNGAFKDIITNQTHIVDIYTILIESASVPSTIKPALLQCRKEFIDVRSRYPTVNDSAEAALVFASASLKEVVAHMERDAESRGLWLPKDNEDDNVGGFMTANQGNTAQFLSGVADFPDGAPTGFKLRREKYIKMREENPGGEAVVAYREKDLELLKESKKKTGDEDPGAHFGNGFSKKFGEALEKAFGDPPSDEDIISPEAAKLKAENVKPKKKTTKAEGEFGKGFARNLRGAFD